MDFVQWPLPKCGWVVWSEHCFYLQISWMTGRYLAKSLHLKIHFKCLSQLIDIDPSLWPIHASKISIRGSKQTMDNICMYASMYNIGPNVYIICSFLSYSYYIICNSYIKRVSPQWQPALPAQQDPGWRRRESKRRMLPEVTWGTSPPNVWKIDINEFTHVSKMFAKSFGGTFV